MNKQEAINQIKLLKARETFMSETIWVKQDDVIEIISQIDEPQKVVVPKFVGEWYERNNDDLNTAICGTITGAYRKVNGENDDFLDTFESWLVYEDNSILTLVKMYLFGYEVEPEKLYTVEIEGVSSSKLFKNIRTNKYLFHSGRGLKGYTDRLTEAEIKQKDERLWQFAKEVE